MTQVHAAPQRNQYSARGMSSGPSTRIEIYAYSRRNPFIPWTGLDLWTMPGLNRRQAALYWKFLDTLERLKIRKSQWRRAEAVTAVIEPTIIAANALAMITRLSFIESPLGGKVPSGV